MNTREQILKDRYLQEDETEDEMYMRVAKCIGKDNNQIEQFYNIMRDGLFLPNTPTLVNAGANKDGGFSACYVLGIEDNIESIYKALTDMAKIHKAFGGTGFNFSNLRPKGSYIHSTGGKATGPVGFMKLFDVNADVIKQGGHREGANMGILNIDHPDIEEFIEAKFDHFNTSVGITDDFMDKVIERPDSKESELFNLICETAWSTGNPGIIFLDELQRHNLVSGTLLNATNPCGEQPLLPYESCNLGSINLSGFVISESEINWGKLEWVIRAAVNFLDNVIDVNQYPLEEIEQVTKASRKIGLGVMGWHDMLIKLGIAYDSNRALGLAEEIMGYITDIAVDESTNLSVSGVVTKNTTVTTIAPTGTLSIIAQCSSGIEPIYDWKVRRKIESGTFDEYNPMYEMAKQKGLLDTAKTIPWEAHIKMQAAFQNFVHNAVSKTINMPNNATSDDIRLAYIMAYKMKCKGITIYRDGSRDEQVLSSIEDNRLGQFIYDSTGNVLGYADDTEYISVRERPKVVVGSTSKCISGCGPMFITVNHIDDKPYEVFVHHNEGGCQSNMEAIGRIISLALRNGIDIESVINQLNKVKCPNAIRSNKSEGDSCAKIIAEQLKGCMERIESDKVGLQIMLDVHTTCPECGNQLNFGEGCSKGVCSTCGWSGCI